MELYLVKTTEGNFIPAYKGQINVKGELLDIAMWVKDGAKGKFFSVAISEPYVKPENKDAIKIETPDLDELDSSLPF